MRDAQFSAARARPTPLARRRSRGDAAPMTSPSARTLVRSPELAELRAFCAAVDRSSIGAAARELGVSQPALSKRLRTLEALAGAQLLERSTRGVTPTPSGADLYRRAQRLLRDAEAVEALMRGFVAEAAPVRIAASATLAEAWLPQALVAFEARHERRLCVELVSANSALVRALVRAGEADLGLAAVDPHAEPDARLTETVVCEDELVLAVAPEHPWAALGAVDPHLLAGTPLIERDPGAHSTRTLDAALRGAGIPRCAPLAQIGSTPAARAAALAEHAPLLVSRLVLGDDEPELVARPLAGLDLRRRFALLQPVRAQRPAPGVRALARHLLAAAPVEAPALTSA